MTSSTCSVFLVLLSLPLARPALPNTQDSGKNDQSISATDSRPDALERYRVTDQESRRILFQVRRKLGKTLGAGGNVAFKRRYTREVESAIKAALLEDRGDPALKLELLTLLARVQIEADRPAAAKLTLKKLLAHQDASFGSETFNEWLDDFIERLVNRRHLRLAKMTLEHLAHETDDANQAESFAMRIGTILATAGKFEPAKDHYLAIAARSPSVKWQALLRAGKMAMTAGAIDEAKAIFGRIAAEAEGAPEQEDARHLRKLLDND